MALVHYLYVGHFIPEDGYVRYQGHEPVVTRAIDMATVNSLLKKNLGDVASSKDIPDLWAMSILPGYIVCDLFGSPAAALVFAAEYAERTGALMLNLCSFSLITPAQVRGSAATMPPIPETQPGAAKSRAS